MTATLLPGLAVAFTPGCGDDGNSSLDLGGDTAGDTADGEAPFVPVQNWSIDLGLDHGDGGVQVEDRPTSNGSTLFLGLDDWSDENRGWLIALEIQSGAVAWEETEDWLPGSPQYDESSDAVVISDGILMGNKEFRAYSSAGSPLWTYETHSGQSSGITARPRVSEGTMFGGASEVVNGEDHQFVAIDMASGDLLWNTKDDIYDQPTPAATADLVIATTYDSVFAVRRSTGDDEWGYSLSGDFFVNSSPLIVDDGVFFVSWDMAADQSELVVLDVDDGTLRFRASIGSGGGDIVSAGDLLLVPRAGADGETLLAVSAIDGAQVWEYSFSTSMAWAKQGGWPEMVAVVDDFVLAASDYEVCAIGLAAGEQRWCVGGMSGDLHSPVVSDDTMLVATADGFVYAFSLDGAP